MKPTKETYKRDLQRQKRPTKETYFATTQQVGHRALLRCGKCVGRDVDKSKETYK